MASSIAYSSAPEALMSKQDISSHPQIMKVLLESRPGQYLKLTVVREGRIAEVNLPFQPMHGPWR